MAIFAVVVGFILFDIITGILEGLYEGKVNSTKLRKGLYHKATEILAVVGAWLLQHAIVYVHLGVSLPLVEAVSAYICLMEAISILENLSAVNPELGKFFSKYLEKLKEEENKNGTEDGD